MQNLRREERSPADRKVSARIAVSIDVIDVSRNGVRVKLGFPVPVGTVIRLGFGADRMRHARIIWLDGDLAGLEFLAPLDDRDMADFLQAT